jgi:hypothetical protein
MRRYGLRCGACGFTTKTLYGVTMEWKPISWDVPPKPTEPIIRNVNLCRRCMKRFGLISERPKELE